MAGARGPAHLWRAEAAGHAARGSSSTGTGGPPGGHRDLDGDLRRPRVQRAAAGAAAAPPRPPPAELGRLEPVAARAPRREPARDARPACDRAGRRARRSSRAARAPGRAAVRPARRRARGPAATAPGAATRQPSAAASGARLAERLAQLAVRVGVRHDRRPAAEPRAPRRGPRSVRMATFSSQPGDRARVADRAGVGLALGALQRGDHVQRLDLRRAGDRAGRERGAHQVRVGRALAQRAPRRRRRGARGRDAARAPAPRGGHRSVARDAPEVVAHQVDDHHVLGRVLGGGQQRVARPPRGGAVPLIGDVTTSSPARRRNSSGEKLSTAPPGSPRNAPYGGSQLAGGGRERVERRRPRAALQPQAEVGLEQLARGDPLARTPRPPSEVPAGRAGRGREQAEPGRARRRGPGQAPAQHLQPPLRRVLGQRLEPPRAGGVLAQHVVVVAEPGAGQRLPAAAGAAAAARPPRRARSPGSRTSRRRPARRRRGAAPRRARPAPRRPPPRAAAPSRRSRASPPSARRARTAARRRAPPAARRRPRCRRPEGSG